MLGYKYPLGLWESNGSETDGKRESNPRKWR